MLIDFLSGVVFAAPSGFESADPAVWRNLPCSDTPFALAERSVLPLREL